MIPFSPPRIDDKSIQAVTEVLQSGWITTGPKTKLFEKELSDYLGVKKVLCLNSWTNAAELFLRWYGIGEGDEVLVPAYTYAASCNIIYHLGATPVLVDSAPGEFHLDLEDLERKISTKTKAVIPVDLGGFPADYRAILSVIEKHRSIFSPSSDAQEKLGRILLFSDAAHSLGAKINSKHAVHSTDVSCYSFHAVKNLTTAEGGALAFNLPDSFDLEEIYRELNISSLHGQTKDALSKTNSGSWKYDIIQPGYKCNMTDLQAAIGRVELNRYESETLPRRKVICEMYHKGFSQHSWYMAPSLVTTDIESSYHLFQLRINGFTAEDRDQLINQLKEKGISTNVHFMPLPYFSFYKSQGFEIADFPNADEAYSSEISLPVYYDLSDENVAFIIESIQSLVEAR